MPAITADTLTLPRIAGPAPTDTERPVRSVTTGPRGYEGEGFPVVRAFAGVSAAALDPFVHMDQMGEVEYEPGEPRGTDWHPHRGFETVTYMIDGRFAHQDSHGGGGLITDGATQWMTAGAGILHIETPPAELVESGGTFHGIQLWVNLPRKDKFATPRYQAIEGQQVKLLSSDDGGALVRIIAGEVDGQQGPGQYAYADHAGARHHCARRPPGRAVEPRLQCAGLRAGGRGRRRPGRHPDPPGSARGDGSRRPRHRRGQRQPGRAQPRDGGSPAGRPADSRARLPLRPVRDELQGGAGRRRSRTSTRASSAASRRVR